VGSEAFGQVEFGLEDLGFGVVFGFQFLLVRLSEVKGALVYHDLDFGSKGWFD